MMDTDWDGAIMFPPSQKLVGKLIFFSIDFSALELSARLVCGKWRVLNLAASTECAVASCTLAQKNMSAI